MKKFICALSLLIGLACSTQVIGQVNQMQSTERVRFYYYPSSNVYYNPTTNEYWYYDKPTTKWVEVTTLPTTITVTKTPRYTIYYKGEDVWKDNAMHQKKYKAKGVKIKTKGKGY